MKKDLGLYIHIPFCVKKCAYCDFLSWKGSDEERERLMSRPWKKKSAVTVNLPKTTAFLRCFLAEGHLLFLKENRQKGY